jgi:hypothetical protein
MYPAQANRPAINRKPKSTIGERRRRVRHRVHTPAYVGVNGSPTATALDLSEVLDISEEGICIQAISPLQTSRIVNLGLDLSEGNTRINMAGMVVWADLHGRTGIRFLEMPDASRSSLKEWLFLNALSACDSVVSAPLPDPEMPRAGFDDLALPSIGPQQNAVPEAFTMPSDSSLIGPAGIGPAGIGPAEERRDVKTARSDLDLRLQRIADRALALTRASGAAIALMRGEQMICVARAGTDAPALGARLQIGSGFSGECVRTRKLLRCDDSETDERVDRDTCRVLAIRSMIAVPICSGNTVSGLLEVFSPHAGAFSANDLSPLERLAHDVLLAIDWSVGMPVSRRALPEKDVAAGRSAAASAAITQLKHADRPRLPRARRSAARRSGKVILAGAIVILVVSGLSLVVPWIKTWAGMPRRTHAEAPAKPQAVAAKPPAPTSADPSNGFTGLRRLAEQGDPVAQYAVGLHCAQGEDVPQDYTEAARWFSLAAEQGHIGAQATLGGLYWAGRGVPKDVTKAYFWLVLARAGGYERSKDLIGPVTAEMTRSQVLEAQQAANDWLTHHQRIRPPRSDSH